MTKRRVKSITKTSLVEVLNNEYITAREISAKFAKQFREGVPNFKEALLNSGIQILLEEKIKYFAPDLYSTFGQDPASKAVFRDVAKVFSLTINWLSGTKVGGSNIVYTPINMVSTIVKSAIKAAVQVHLMKGVDHDNQAAIASATVLSNILGDSISSIFTQLDRARQIDGLSNQNFITYLLKEFKSNPTRPLKTAITALSGTFLRYYPNQFLSSFIFRKGITLATQFICFAMIAEATNLFIKQENDVAPEHLTLTFKDLFQLSPEVSLSGLLSNPYELLEKFSQIDYSSEIKLFAAGASHYNNIFRRHQFAVMSAVLLTKSISEMLTTMILSPPARIINNYLSATIISTIAGVLDQFYNRYDAAYSLSFTTENTEKHEFNLIKYSIEKTALTKPTKTRDANERDNLTTLNERLICSGLLSNDKSIKKQIQQIVSKLDSKIKPESISIKRTDMLHQLTTPYKEKNNSVIFNPTSLLITIAGIASYMLLSNPLVPIISGLIFATSIGIVGIGIKMHNPQTQTLSHNRVQAQRETIHNLPHSHRVQAQRETHETKRDNKYYGK